MSDPDHVASPGVDDTDTESRHGAPPEGPDETSGLDEEEPTTAPVDDGSNGTGS